MTTGYGLSGRPPAPAPGGIENHDVLDLGCGVGYFASLCTDLGARTVACDFAESMVTRSVQRYGSKFPVIRASAEKLPFRPGSFDVVLALDVIEHLYQAVEMLSTVSELLKPTGRLIITTDRVGFQIVGHLVELLGKGVLKRYKWGQGIYEFTRRSGDELQGDSA